MAYAGDNILTCQEIKDSEKTLEADSDPCHGENYKKMTADRIERQRTAAINRLVVEPRKNCYANRLYYELGDQANGLHTGDESPEDFVTRMGTYNVKQLECLGDQDRANTLKDLMALILKQSVLLREKEAACRSDKKCTTHREDLAAGDAICSSIASIKMGQDQIKGERSNPSGVVSLTALHEAGELIQMSQAQLREEKADFRKTYKREFPESVCREVWSKPEVTPEDPRTTCQPHRGPSKTTGN